MDPQQAHFSEFEVPDPGRIAKVHAWLRDHGHLRAAGRRVSVLELGYARGGLLDVLEPAGAYDRFAADLHDRAVGPGITFFRHDCNEPFTFADGRTFDVVFAGELIEHIYDDRRFVQHARAVLAPGGVLALTTPNLFFLLNRVVMLFGRMPYYAYAAFHYHFYSRDTLAQMVAECGFDVRRVTSTHVFVSSRKHKVIGRLCERLGDVFPTFGAHLILFAVKK